MDESEVADLFSKYRLIVTTDACTFLKRLSKSMTKVEWLQKWGEVRETIIEEQEAGQRILKVINGKILCDIFKANTLKEWSPEEKEDFLVLFKKHQKDFRAIAEELGTKTTSQCVHLYYHMDREMYDGLMQTFKRQRKRIRGEGVINREGGVRTRAAASLLQAQEELLKAQNKSKKPEVVCRQNEFCRLGCICESLEMCDKMEPEHCEQEQCIFGCICKPKDGSKNGTPTSGTSKSSTPVKGSPSTSVSSGKSNSGHGKRKRPTRPRNKSDECPVATLSSLPPVKKSSTIQGILSRSDTNSNSIGAAAESIRQLDQELMLKFGYRQQRNPAFTHRIYCSDDIVQDIPMSTRYLQVQLAKALWVTVHIPPTALGSYWKIASLAHNLAQIAFSDTVRLQTQLLRKLSTKAQMMKRLLRKRLPFPLESKQFCVLACPDLPSQVLVGPFRSPVYEANVDLIDIDDEETRENDGDEIVVLN